MHGSDPHSRGAGSGPRRRPQPGTLRVQPEVHRDHPTPVGYLTDAAEAGLSLIGWLPAAEYEARRRIIGEGGPLQVHYETRDGREGYLRRLALGRADATLRSVASAQHGHGDAEAAAFAMPL